MRYVLALSFLLGFPLLSPAQDVSVEGLSLGMPWPEAEQVLKERPCDFQEMHSEYSYAVECWGTAMLAIAAPKENFGSEQEATVKEIAYSLSSMDASPQKVVEKYNRYKNNWSDKLGLIDPTKRGESYYWTWSTDSIEARIVYAEPGGQPHTLDVTISRP